jgi:hypothetical protein
VEEILDSSNRFDFGDHLPSDEPRAGIVVVLNRANSRVRPEFKARSSIGLLAIAVPILTILVAPVVVAVSALAVTVATLVIIVRTLIVVVFIHARDVIGIGSVTRL